MVCYFILRHICMIGSHRPVRRQGRKPGTSSPTRRRLGRGDGRRQVDSCQVQAVLPVVGIGTTVQRYYRPLLPLATDGSNGCSKPASGTTGARAVLSVMTGTIGPKSGTTGHICACAHLLGHSTCIPLLLTYSPSLSPNYPCLVAGLYIEPPPLMYPLG